MIIHCKNCGGSIEIGPDKTFGTCEYCGSVMTFPKVDDDQRAAAFNRGNYFRRIGEFDKALAVYERIVREDENDAEAHWCCALCRFGIEYVEDPATMEWLPTCHRASFDSFLEDVDYLAAVEHSAGITRRQYQKDAAKIAEVQRGILATSQNAEPYDVFICYKETDEKGQRTRDSLMAQDIYYQLTEQGRKVFFARITLEEVAGTQYEPYIFAALNSAKVMVVVGTKAEHLNAVWVKNEWSRFLAMMKKDHGKLLLPCYRDMDPYDLPEQLSVLQSYDMAKIGFIQDLTRGIAKVLDVQKQPEPKKEPVVVQQNAGGNVNTLLKRAFMFLEDGDWKAADEYCEKVLDIDPENAQAYLGKLMVESQIKKPNDLRDCKEPFEKSNHFQKIVRYGDKKLVSVLKEYNAYIYVRKQRETYDDAYILMNEAETEEQYQKAAELFETIPNAGNASELRQVCLERAEEAGKEAIYNKAKEYLCVEKPKIADFQKAVKEFEKIPCWRDADLLREKCEQQIGAINNRMKVARRKATKKKRAKITIKILLTCILILAVPCYIFYGSFLAPAAQYYKAVALMEDGEYLEAISLFSQVPEFNDSKQKINECNNAIRKRDYHTAISMMEAGEYKEAYEIFSSLDDYADSKEYAEEAFEKAKIMELKQSGIGDQVVLGNYMQGDIEWIVLDIQDGKMLLLSKYALDCKPYLDTQTYEETGQGTTWEESFLHSWLLTDFVNGAFSDAEKAMLAKRTTADEDWIFLLSVEETETYLTSFDMRQCEPSAFVSANYRQGVKNGKCYWWLRSQGDTLDTAVIITPDGEIVDEGRSVNSQLIAVRPAMWIEVDT